MEDDITKRAHGELGVAREHWALGKQECLCRQAQEAEFPFFERNKK